MLLIRTGMVVNGRALLLLHLHAFFADILRDGLQGFQRFQEYAGLTGRQ